MMGKLVAETALLYRILFGLQNNVETPYCGRQVQHNLDQDTKRKCEIRFVS